MLLNINTLAIMRCADYTYRRQNKSTERCKVASKLNNLGQNGARFCNPKWWKTINTWESFSREMAAQLRGGSIWLSGLETLGSRILFAYFVRPQRAQSSFLQLWSRLLVRLTGTAGLQLLGVGTLWPEFSDFQKHCKCSRYCVVGRLHPQDLFYS